MFDRNSWNRLWRSLELECPTSVYDELVSRHSEAHRAYHTIHHVDECLAQLESIRASAQDPGAIELAIWFHDAVYDTHRSDNEDQSAELAKRVLHGQCATESFVERVVGHILATKHASTQVDPDSRLVVDIDLAILGAPTARFDEYDRQIRAEYAWVPIETYVDARRKILAGFLARGRIYSTDEFRERLESRARENLDRALARLQ